MAEFILTFPFLITLLAATIAGASATLLRRAAVLLSPSLLWLARLMLAASAAAFVWSFLWAWGWEVINRPAGIVTSAATYGPNAFASGRATAVPLAETIVGWLLVLVGAGLAGWAISTRLRAWRYRWAPMKRLTRSPFRQIRRPEPLSLLIAALGATLVVGTGSAWICFLAGVIGYSALLELADWETRLHRPELAGYMRGTPRYLHRFWKRMQP